MKERRTTMTHYDQDRTVWMKGSTNSDTGRAGEVIRTWRSRDGEAVKTRVSFGTTNPRTTVRITVNGTEQDTSRNASAARLGHNTREDRRHAAEEMAAARAELTSAEQLDRLDARLGLNVGAEKERARLLADLPAKDRSVRAHRTGKLSAEEKLDRSVAAAQRKATVLSRPAYRARKRAEAKQTAAAQ